MKLKNVLKIALLLVFAPISVFGQISGVVVDSENNEALPMSNVKVVEANKVIVTDLDGSFKIEGLESGTYTLEISYIGYISTTKSVEYKGQPVDLGKLGMGTEAIGIKEVEVFSSIVSEDEAAPTAITNVTAEDIETKMGAQEFPEMMKSTPGVYVSTEGGGFGSSSVWIRGFSPENTAVLINGIPVNDMENGNVYWSNWGGMNDVTRNQQIQRGLGVSKLPVSSVGGTINIITKPTQQRKGLKLSYASANRSYQHRIMASYSTGKLQNGWAFTLLGSTRQGWGYREGTKTEAYSYFLSAYKEFGEKHQFMLSAFGAPQTTWGGANAGENSYYITAQDYEKDEFGNIIKMNGVNSRYNPAWGEYKGEIKSSRINKYHKPMVMANHYWDINDNWQLASGAYFSFGSGGGSGFDRMSGTPLSQPVPYFLSPGIDKRYFQVQWDSIYAYNKRNQVNVYHINGTNDSISGKRSQYILRENRNNHIWTGFISNINGKIGDKTELTVGIDHRWYRGKHFQLLTDLLGGDFWIDRERFRNYDADMTRPNRVAYEGDTIGYKYNATVSLTGLFAQAEHKFNEKLKVFGTATLSYNRTYRNGLMMNGAYLQYDTTEGEFTQNSMGLSPTYKFINYSAKGGFTYQVTGRNRVFFNAGYFTRAPFLDAIFADIRTSNIPSTDFHEDAHKSQQIMSLEAGYRYKSPKVVANLSLYSTKWSNRTDVFRVFDTEYFNYARYVMQDITSLHRGVEVDAQVNIIRNLRMTGMVSVGDWRYVGNGFATALIDPGLTVSSKNGGDNTRTLYVDGVKVGGSAQTTSALGLFYRGKKYYYLGCSANYYGRMYKSFNPSNKVINEEYYLQNQRIPDAFTLDIYGGKSWKKEIGGKSVFIKLKANINNVLDNRFMIRGFEASITPSDPYADGFSSFYFGRTYFLALEFNM